MLDLVAGSREGLVLLESDDVQIGRQQIVVRWRQRRQEAVINSAGQGHCWLPAVAHPLWGPVQVA